MSRRPVDLERFARRLVDAVRGPDRGEPPEAMVSSARLLAGPVLDAFPEVGEEAVLTALVEECRRALADGSGTAAVVQRVALRLGRTNGAG